MVQAKIAAAPAAAPRHEAVFELPALRLPPEVELTDELLLRLSAINDEWRLERTAEGELSMTLPAEQRSAGVHFELCGQLGRWIIEGGGGRGFESAIGCRLLDGSVREPDGCWIDDEHAARQLEDGFIVGAPAFVLEVRSRFDSVERQQEKMERWMANGTRLGWLVDPFDEIVWVYRQGEEQPEQLARPMQLSGEPVLKGFTATFERIWRE